MKDWMFSVLEACLINFQFRLSRHWVLRWLSFRPYEEHWCAGWHIHRSVWDLSKPRPEPNAVTIHFFGWSLLITRDGEEFIVDKIIREAVGNHG